VQELTREGMQARVMSVLESIGAAMPGVGFVLGGLITTGQDPRATFLFAGIGVLVIVAIAVPLLGSKWPEQTVSSKPNELDADRDVVVELIAGSGPIQSNSEVES
jgi:MFS family permease